MATIRAYTTIEQSRKLAEILPLESADMCFNTYNNNMPPLMIPYSRFTEFFNMEPTPAFLIPCWSLAALLDVMPKEESIDCSIYFGYYNGKGEYIEKWLCAFEKEGETTDDFITETIDGDNPVDACVAMIERLHELNLL